MDFLSSEAAVLTSYTFNIKEQPGFMFWGGNYQENAKPCFKRQTKRRASTDSNECPIVRFSLKVGLPLLSRCENARINFENTGVYGNIFRKKLWSFRKAMTLWRMGALAQRPEWVSVIASLDGDGLRIYETQDSTEPLVFIECKAISDIEIETSGERTKGKKNVEDNCNLIINTYGSAERIKLRFDSQKSRKFWVEVFKSVLYLHEHAYYSESNHTYGKIFQRISSLRRFSREASRRGSELVRRGSVSTMSRFPSLLNQNISVMTRLSGLFSSSKELESSDDDDDDDDEYVSSNAETASIAATLRGMMLLRQKRKASPVEASQHRRSISVQTSSTSIPSAQSPVPSLSPLSPPPKRSSLMGSLQVTQLSAKHRKTQSQPQLNTEGNRISRQSSKSWKSGGPSLIERIKEKGLVGGVDAE